MYKISSQELYKKIMEAQTKEEMEAIVWDLFLEIYSNTNSQSGEQNV